MLQIYNAWKLFFFPRNDNKRIFTEIAKNERGIESLGVTLDTFFNRCRESWKKYKADR